MTSLHSSVGSKSTDPHLPSPGATGGANFREDVASSSSVEGSSSLVIHSSWITRLRPPPWLHLPPPPAAEVGAPAAAEGSAQLKGTASTGESHTREPEVAQEPGRGAATEEEKEGGRVVAGFGPFQVSSNKRRRLLLGRGHKQLHEHHGAAAAAGVPDKEAFLADGCFPIFQKMARVGDVCRGEQVAVRDRKEEEEKGEKLQVEDGVGRAMDASARGLLSAAAAAAAASSQPVGSGSAPWPRLQGFW